MLLGLLGARLPHGGFLLGDMRAMVCYDNIKVYMGILRYTPYRRTPKP